MLCPPTNKTNFFWHTFPCTVFRIFVLLICKIQISFILSLTMKHNKFLSIFFLMLLSVPRSSTCICRQPPACVASLLLSVHVLRYSSFLLLCACAKICEERAFKFRIRFVMNICIPCWSIYFELFTHTFPYFRLIPLTAFSDSVKSSNGLSNKNWKFIEQIHAAALVL
jgi:hypothetical protein